MATYSDPDGMPEDERMTPAELRVVREHLGLSGAALARLLGVSARTVRHWEEGRYPVPDGVRLEIEQMEQEAAEFVDAAVKQLLDLPDPVVVTYRTDADYHRAHPQVRYPASWHRAVVARVAQEVPGLSIIYQESPVYIVDLSPTDAAALAAPDSDLAANGLEVQHLGEGRVRMPATTLDWLRANRTPDDDGSITEDDDGLLLLWVGGIPHEIQEEA